MKAVEYIELTFNPPECKLTWFNKSEILFSKFVCFSRTSCTPKTEGSLFQIITDKMMLPQELRVLWTWQEKEVTGKNYGDYSTI